MSFFDPSKLEHLQTQAQAKPRPLVLVVDDEVANRRVMAGLLQSRYEVLEAADGVEALKLIESLADPRSLACIVSDQRMPHLTGVELFQRLRITLPDTPRIIVTGFVDVAVIVEAINQAQLYKFIIKPFDPHEFQLTVQRAVEAYELRVQLEAHRLELEDKVRERTEALMAANRRLEEISLTDPLTGLKNRRYLLNHIDKEVALCLRRHEDWEASQSAPCPADADILFFLVDIDHFKQINDTWGHAAGDRVLIQMRERLSEVFRESDCLVRWGGEEFLAVARATGRSDAPRIAERLRNAIAQRPFQLDENSSVTITCSIGFAAFPFVPTQPHLLTWEQTIQMADRALYLAKENGRNAWFGTLNNTRACHTQADVAQWLKFPLAAVARGELCIVSNQGHEIAPVTE